MTPARRAAGVACLLLLGAACPGPRPLPAPLPPLAGSPLEVLALARARVEGMQRLNAVAVARGFTALPGLSVTLDIFAARPGRLYVAARGFFGPPTDEVITDGERFLWRSTRPGAGARGPATPEALGALLPVALPPSQWVGLLLGLPLPDEPARAVQGCREPETGALRCVRVQLADSEVELWVDGAARVREARLSGARGGAQVSYLEPRPAWRDLAAVLRLAAGKLTAEVRFSEVELDGLEPPPSLFAPLGTQAAP
ncbi:MAG: hypothetical protein HY904_06515 [Deltaproteobacteria bacterium]|nr:hypothetical protein [Deltaproteobacteria bacterium]